MSVRVRWSSAFTAYTGAADGDVEVGNNEVMTPETIARAAGFTNADIASVQAFVNGTLAPRNTALKDGDEVNFEIDIHPG